MESLLLLHAAATAVVTAGATPPPLATEAVARANNSVYVELLGVGLLYSLNYERFFLDGRLGVRVGVTFLPASDQPAFGGTWHFPPWIAFPTVASYYIGSGPHALQLGVGANVCASCWGPPPALPAIVVGYRYAPPGSNVDLGLGFTPLFAATEWPLGFLPWGGATLGARF